jgi:hypothetical protein
MTKLLHFSANTPVPTQEEIRRRMGVTNTNSMEKYLGLPPMIGRSKRAAFEDIKTRVWERVQGWKEKLLSQAGREVLVKAVLQSIPTYTMSCFKIPTSLCSEIHQMMSNFWWGQRGTRKENALDELE